MAMLSGCSRKADLTQGKSYQASMCANRLRTLAGAKRLWAEQNGKTANDTPTINDLLPFIRGAGTCPAGGTYTLGKVDEMPSCSIPEHQAAFNEIMKEQQQPAQ